MSKRRGVKAQDHPIGDANDPYGLYNRAQVYLSDLLVKHYSPRTVAGRRSHLRYFIQWCDDRGVHRINEVTRPTLESYQRYLYHYRKDNGEPLSSRSQAGRLVPVKHYFSYLVKQGLLLANPASDLELPRQDYRLPRAVLSASEAEAILNLPDISTPSGMRDRAMMEVLYSTGIRRMELQQLEWSDIDGDRGTLFIRSGKGKKDRMVPIGDRAVKWVRLYHEHGRPCLVVCDTPILFLNPDGEAFSANGLSALVKRYVTDADIGKTGSCHLFRHTMATLMLEGGADVRYIQAMLGHARLDTTQIYTQVSIKQLKEIHTLAHPAKWEGKG